MITKLTPEQEALLPVYNAKWLAIGLSCERVQKVPARRAIKLLYKCGGLPAPKNIRFAKGPMHAKKILSEFDIPDSVLASVIYGPHEEIGRAHV